MPIVASNKGLTNLGASLCARNVGLWPGHVSMFSNDRIPGTSCPGQTMTDTLTKPSPPGKAFRCQVPDQKLRQWWLGTKWESPALASALCRSVLLTCARASSAETGKCPGGGDRYAFLGVKGSPVQIRPSRLVFRTPVPRNGNETGHDHSHLTGRDEQNIQGGGYAILLIALPRWPRSRRGGPVR